MEFMQHVISSWITMPYQVCLYSTYWHAFGSLDNHIYTYRYSFLYIYICNVSKRYCSFWYFPRYIIWSFAWWVLYQITSNLVRLFDFSVSRVNGPQNRKGSPKNHPLQCSSYFIHLREDHLGLPGGPLTVLCWYICKLYLIKFRSILWWVDQKGPHLIFFSPFSCEVNLRFISPKCWSLFYYSCNSLKTYEVQINHQ